MTCVRACIHIVSFEPGHNLRQTQMTLTVFTRSELHNVFSYMRVRWCVSAFFWNEKYHSKWPLSSSPTPPPPSPPPLPLLLMLLWMTFCRFCVQLNDSRCHPYGWWFPFHFRLVDFVGRRKCDADKMRTFWSALGDDGGHIRTRTHGEWEKWNYLFCQNLSKWENFQPKKSAQANSYLCHHFWYVRARARQACRHCDISF